MRNLKHTIMAIVSVAMVGTLGFFQVSDLSAQIIERDSRLSTSNNIESILFTEDAPEATQEAKEEATEAPSEEITEQKIAQKSTLTSAYAKVTGTTDLKAAPGDSAESIGTMSGAETLEILESTEGWYKVMVNGKAGYVKKDFVTLDKEEAEVAKKQYDHYKRGKITSDTGVMVRKSGSETAECIGTLDCNDEVIITDVQNNYVKVLYSEDYTEGYVVNTGVEFTGEWYTKEEVNTAKEEAERRIAAEAAAEAERQRANERESARLAAMGYSNSETKKSSQESAPATSSGSGAALVASAKKYLGVPYVWGGTSPRGFDCSGLVQYVCRQNGISVPRTAASQRGAGKYVSRANLQPGDLVFFGKGGRITHVGIYAGNGQMIHAPQTGDVVKYSSINSTYRVNNYAGAVRVW